MSDIERDEKGRVKPGQVLNPNGGPRLSEEEKTIRRFTKQRYEKAMHKLTGLSLDELHLFLKEKRGDVLESAIAAILVKCIATGDVVRLEKFTDRMIGPVPKRVNISGDSIADLFSKMANGELTDDGGPED